MMKSEPRPFASLSSGLLARKGAARPAMRPQGFGQSGSGLEDLGWNDMGFEPPRPVLAPVADEPEPPVVRPNPVTGLTPSSPVHAVHEELVQRLGHEADEDVDDTAEPVPADVPPVAKLIATPVEVEAEAEVEIPAPVAEVPAEVLAEVPAEVLAEVQAEVPMVRVPAPARVRAAAPAAVPKVVPQSRRAVGSHGKAAFTLRLDGERHLKLRLACAVTGTSAQQLVTRALDELLGAMPEVDEMAQRAPERRVSKG